MGFLDRIFKRGRQVFKQRKWTEGQLKAEGFRYYPTRKRVTMARILPKEEAPKVIKTPWDTIVAQEGYFIAYDTGTVVRQNLDDYEPRPIEPHIFRETYRRWDDPSWRPSPPEAHLMKLGCKPYYKIVGVWAKRLREPLWVQSIESPKPILAPAGAWLCVGTAGEPWTVTDEWFHHRYITPGSGTYQRKRAAAS